MSSSSAAVDLVAYGRERIARWRIAVLVALVAGAALVAEAPGGTADVLARAALSALLIAQFRVWDDLADREYDSVRHPARVMVRSPATAWFWASFVALGAAATSAIAMLVGVEGLTIHCGLMVLLAAAYHGPWSLQRFTRTQLVLLKYPAFITILNASVFSGGTVLAGMAVYLLLSVYEWHDDPALRDGHAAGRLVVVLAAGLVVAAILASGRI